MGTVRFSRSGRNDNVPPSDVHIPMCRRSGAVPVVATAPSTTKNVDCRRRCFEVDDTSAVDEEQSHVYVIY